MSAPGRATLTVVGKPDCHLCHVMAAVVRDAVGDRLDVEEADVRSRPEWAAHLLEIPILLLGETEVARHRITAAELRARLAQLGLDV